VNLQVAESWVEAPLRQFVEDSRVRIAVLMHPSGQVLGQSGFGRRNDVMTACALSAAINASAAELGRQLEGKPFAGLHYTGTTHQLHLGVAPTTRGALLLLSVFGDSSSLGLVQIFFDEFRTRLAESAPAAAPEKPALAADFEGDLNKNLAALFGRG
jgi:hypothetical protein